MHILESYSLNSGGHKIEKSTPQEDFFPLTFDKYIIIHSTSKPAKTYDLWVNVLSIIRPTLTEQNIQIVQIGGKDDKVLPNIYNLCGQTNINQTTYLIKNCELILGVDSFPVHIASLYDKKIVSLYSNNFISAVGPYFGSKENQVCLEPDRKGAFPSFCLDENPKTINTIAPEKVAESVLSLLKLNFNYQYKTLFFGDHYINNWLECIPDQYVNVNTFGIDTVVYRMDILFNEQNLINQLQLCNVAIVTNLPINLQVLFNFRPRIKEFIYIVDKNHNPKFIEQVQKMGIKIHLQTYLSEEELNEIKLQYLDIGLIIKRKTYCLNDVEVLKDKKIDNLYYQTGRFILGRSKIYQSIAAYINDLPVPSFDQVPQKFIDSLEFWRELNYFMILEEKL